MQFAADFDDAVEFIFGDLAAADALGGNAGLLGDDAGGQLFARHFEREEGDDAAIGHLHRAIGLVIGLVGLGDVIGDVGGERGFAHGGAAGEDDEIGGLQAAHFFVEVLEARGNAGEAAVTLIGAGGHVDGVRQGAGEGMEALTVFSGFGEAVERLLGALDEILGGFLDRRIEGFVHDVGADADELAALGQLVNHAAIFFGIDDGGGRRGKPREIGGAADFLHGLVAVEIGFQRDRRGELADADEGRGRFVDAGMDGFEEMIGQEEGRDAVAGLVVHQDGAKKRLFRLKVLGRGAEGIVWTVGFDGAEVCLSGHGKTLAVSRG